MRKRGKRQEAGKEGGGGERGRRRRKREKAGKEAGGGERGRKRRAGNAPKDATEQSITTPVSIRHEDDFAQGIKIMGVYVDAQRFIDVLEFHQPTFIQCIYCESSNAYVVHRIYAPRSQTHRLDQLIKVVLL